MAADPESRRLTPQRLALLLVGLLVLIALSWWRLSGPPPESPRRLLAVSGPTMGTSYEVKVVLAGGLELNGQELRRLVEPHLFRVNELMSTYDRGSELSRFNASDSTAPFPVAEETAEVVAAALKVSEQTAGAFDPTLGPIVNAYGFGPDERNAAPTEEELAALHERVGYKKLELDRDPPALTKTHPDLYLDLSALAKGFAVDAVVEALARRGVAHYLVEIGGEVRAKGRNADGDLWRVGIEKPIENARAVQRVIPLDGRAMATSGDYRNYYEDAGRRISHMIDGRTRRPISHNLASASVVHDRCLWADAYATAIMALGPEDGLLLAEILELPALLLIREPDGSFTERPSPVFAEQFGFETTEETRAP